MGEIHDLGETYISHHGIIGMKWGVRRYQNKDGTYTAAGRARRDRDIYENGGKKEKNRVNTDDDTKEARTRNAQRWSQENTERTKRAVDESVNLTRNLGNTADAVGNLSKHHAAREAARNRKDLSKYSDQELRTKINREYLERQYNDLFNAPKQRVGSQYVKDYLQIIGGGLGAVSSGLGIALAVKQLRGK